MPRTLASHIEISIDPACCDSARPATQVGTPGLGFVPIAKVVVLAGIVAMNNAVVPGAAPVPVVMVKEVELAAVQTAMRCDSMMVLLVPSDIVVRFVKLTAPVLNTSGFQA